MLGRLFRICEPPNQRGVKLRCISSAGLPGQVFNEERELCITYIRSETAKDRNNVYRERERERERMCVCLCVH